MKNKRVAIVLVVLSLVFIIVGSTFAYLSWQTSENQKTNVVFTVTSDFRCAADGGGNITQNDVTLIPTTVSSSTTSNYIKRTVKVTPTITRNGKTIYMDLWLDIKDIGTGLTNSDNFMYAFTTSSTSNTTGVVSSGNFNGKVVGDKINLLSSKEYSSTMTDTYYLWIWLDAKETSSETMNQTFSLSLNGNCGDVPVQAPNAPELDSGMIPVTITDNGAVTTISSSDSSWYNYDKQQWANAVLVTEASRSSYLNTTGVTIPEDNILAYYVWIPRYKYKIWTTGTSGKGLEQEIEIVFESKTSKTDNAKKVECSTLTNVNEDTYPECYGLPYVVTAEEKQKLYTFNYNFMRSQGSSITQDEAIQLTDSLLETGQVDLTLNGTTSTYTIDAIINVYNQNNSSDPIYPKKTFIGTNEIFKDVRGLYYTHPAFTFGDKELGGIWVGKFETTGDATTPTIKPNTASLTSQDVSTEFITSLKFAGGTLNNGVTTFTGSNTYGLTTSTDSHMMKNTEWGAVAYLSHSKYGINSEVRVNNYMNNINSKTLTGCGASTANASRSTTCGITYGSSSIYPQSTTGNISGIFDMSGGAWEYVMGVFANSDGTLWSGNSTSNNSGFNGLLGTAGTAKTDGIAFPENKYYEVYKASSGTTINNVLTACSGGYCYGRSLSETSSWYGDYASFVSATGPWFFRGGYCSDGANAGVFYFGGTYGGAYVSVGFRAVACFA